MLDSAWTFGDTPNADLLRRNGDKGGVLTDPAVNSESSGSIPPLESNADPEVFSDMSKTEGMDGIEEIEGVDSCDRCEELRTAASFGAEQSAEFT